MATSITLNPEAIHNSDGTFTITGKVSDLSGVTHVGISRSIEDEPLSPAGSASVAPDGSFSYLDYTKYLKRGDFVATAFLSDGASVNSAPAPFTFYADGHESTTTPTGEPGTSTVFRKDGSSAVSILAGGQTLHSSYFDTFNNGGAPENTFVFDPGHGLDIVQLFRVNGEDHDVLSFKGADFANSIAEVLGNTHQVRGVGAVIYDPTSGDTVRLDGITKAQLVHNQGDITFHV